MRIILLEKLENLGNKGTILSVKSGYARNFLVPYGKAIIATKDNIQMLEDKQKEFDRDLVRKFAIAQDTANKIKDIKSITISAKSGLEGKLFGSIGSRDIAVALSKLAGIQINKKFIYCLNGKLRNIGKHQVVFKPHHDVSVNIEVNIVSRTK